MSDPRLLNYILLGIYIVNSFRWLFNGSYADALYWFGAFVITTAVTLK